MYSPPPPPPPQGSGSRDSCLPQVPDELTRHVLQLKGVQCDDIRLWVARQPCHPCIIMLALRLPHTSYNLCRVRLVSLATQKFVTDVAGDALQVPAPPQHTTLRNRIFADCVVHASPQNGAEPAEQS